MDFENFKTLYLKKEPKELTNKINKNPILSVIVLAFQHRNFIVDCLEGILNQNTDFEFEIIIGEDHSTDGTREICLEYAKKYPEKIRLFLHHALNKKKVLGIQTGNFNAFYNFYQARGNYIAICDGDDYWTDKNKLQTQVDFLKNNPNFVLSYHPFTEKYEFATVTRNQISLKQESKDLSKEDLSGLITHPLLSTVCFRKSFNELPEEMMNVINLDSFILSILGTFGKGKFQPEIQASIYRRHTGGIWTKKNRELQLLIKIHLFKNLVSYYKDKNKRLKAGFHNDLKNTRKMLSIHYLKNWKLSKAMKSLVILFTHNKA